MIDLLLKYFPDLTPAQRGQMEMLAPLYEDWNAKINVISRKDIGNLYEHHVLHSLAIAKTVRFADGTRVMDLGCGGGFPGIPLAIVFPRAQFHLVDSVGKKVRVAQAVAEAVGLKNVECSHARAEEVRGRDYDFVVTRATMTLTGLMQCARRLVARTQHNTLPNGFLALKGGGLEGEIAPMRRLCTVWDIADIFDEPYFETKKVVHVAVAK